MAQKTGLDRISSFYKWPATLNDTAFLCGGKKRSKKFADRLPRLIFAVRLKSFWPGYLVHPWSMIRCPKKVN
jgi:hypothetical protein